MSHITAFERIQKLTAENDTPSLRLALWIEEMTRQVNLNTIEEGSGSPEGVLAAEPKTLYMDTSGTAGNILYIKKTGTGDTGWILI